MAEESGRRYRPRVRPDDEEGWRPAVARLDERDNAQQNQIDRNTRTVEGFPALVQLMLDKLEARIDLRFDRHEEQAREAGKLRLQRYSVIFAAISVVATIGGIVAGWIHILH